VPSVDDCHWYVNPEAVIFCKLKVKDVPEHTVVPELDNVLPGAGVPVHAGNKITVKV
jgi:hypothetical protein